MPSAIPAPAPPVKLAWDAPAPANVPVSPLAGALQVTPGTGLVGRVGAGKLLLDASQTDPPQTLSLFVPGAVSAKTLAVLRNARLSGRCLISLLEANVQTAQTTADVANFFGVTISGASGGSLTLPFATAAGKHFLSDHSQGVAIRTNAPSGGTNPSGQPGGAYGWTPGALTTVTGFSANVGVQDSGFHPVAGTLTGRLLDANFNEIAGTRRDVAVALGVRTVFFPFPVSQQLAAGSLFWFAVDTLDDPAGPTNHVLQFANAAPDNPQGLAQLSSPLGWSNAAGRVTLVGGVSLAAQVFGQASLIELDGDLTIAYTTTGAPLGTAAPSDVNIRIDIAAG